NFATLTEYQQAIEQDRHSVTLSLDDFVNVPPVDKSDPRILYEPENMDFRLKGESLAVDAGTVLPGITDGFTGRAPDLGALELSGPLPHYGPRKWPVGDTPTGARSEVGPSRD